MEADTLLAATYRGEPGAFEALVRSQAGRLHHVATRVAGDGSLADDILQETFLRILRVPPAARPSRGAGSWLARVTVRVAINVLESERARRRREERYASERSRTMQNQTRDPTDSPDELHSEVAEALASLPPRTRAALWLHVVEEEGVREIAVCLESSRSAVSRRIQGGLELLRARLGTSGAALAGVTSLSRALRGAAVPPAEALLERIISAGDAALSGGATVPRPLDALDAALAVRVRPASIPGGPAVAAALTVVLCGLAALGVRGWLQSTGEVGTQRGPVAAAQPAAASNPETSPARLPVLPPPSPTPPPVPAVTLNSLAGSVRGEDGTPIDGAIVYLTPVHSRDEDLLVALGSLFRADRFRRATVFSTVTDSEGHWRFEGIPELGSARLGVYREGYGDPRTAGSRGLEEVTIAAGHPTAGVELVLPEGKTLAGRILGPDGTPVTDAVIAAATAWTPTDHIFWPAGLGVTDAEGQFHLGFEARASGCHLHVCSERHGQVFFVGVPLTEEPVELPWSRPASLEGTMTWADGAPASGLTVRAHGKLPEPPIPVERMGLRSHVVHSAEVSETGEYHLDGLHPGLSYEVLVIDASRGEPAALRNPLTPRDAPRFTPGAGEVKAWDGILERPLLVRGRVRTAALGSPVNEAQVVAHKDGRRLEVPFNWTDADGKFVLELPGGPGTYRLHAAPPVGLPSPDGAPALIDRSFGRDVVVTRARSPDVDLLIFEPVILPLRVRKADGSPPATVQVKLKVTLPGGASSGHEFPCSLDAVGCGRLTFHYPVEEISCELGGSAGGPTVKAERTAGVPGTILPEVAAVLPLTCGLRMRLLDSRREPHRRRWARLRVASGDSPAREINARTDDEGWLDNPGDIEASLFKLEIRSAGAGILWTSQQLDGRAGGTIDLGEVVLEWKEDGSGEL